MYEDYYFNRPLPPPRPTAHLWFGILLSGVGLGLGAFYMAELRTPRPVQLVTLDIDLRKGTGDPKSAELQNLLTDVKELMGALRQTQRALADAQTRIAALEQENRALREAGALAKAPDPAPADPAAPTAAPAPTAPAVTTPPAGMGGPLVRAPDVLPITTRAPDSSERARADPQACWTRAGTMIAIYRITVRDDGFALAPAWDDSGQGAWPAEFTPVMEGFRGTPLGAQPLVSRTEFKKLMRPYFNFGAVQESRCRFLVSVVNETSSKEAWKSGLTLIERYFFKKLRGRSADLALRAER